MIFLIHLWKEWRDHRALFLAQLAIVMVGSGLVVWQSPYPDWREVLVPEILALGAVTTLLLGGDLVAGEVRRGKHLLLARLPDALLHSFVAKLVALVTSFAVVTTAGALTAVLVQQFVNDEGAGLWHSGVWLMPWPDIVATFLIIAVWTLAASCWIRHGSLALPGALVVLAVAVGPLLLIHRAYPGIRPVPFDTVAISLTVGLAGLIGAFVSYTRGFRFGGAGAAAAWGVPLALVLCVPAWGLGYHRLQEWTTFEPGGRNFRILAAVLGEGGRYAFVSANHSNRSWEFTQVHSLMIDLRDGSWRDLDPDGDGGGWIYDINGGMPAYPCTLGVQQQSVLYRKDTLSIAGRGSTSQILDGASGRILARSGDPDFDELLRAHGRATTQLRFGGGRRAWILDDRLEFDGEDGQVESLPWNPTFRPRFVRGEGFIYRTNPEERDSREFYDLNLGRTIENDGLADDYRVFMLHHRWILTRRSRGLPEPVLWDPMTRRFEEATYLNRDDNVVSLLDDRTLLVSSPLDSCGPSRLSLVDPDSGERVFLTYEDGEEALVMLAYGSYRALTSGVRPVLELYWREGHSFARLDAAAGVITRGTLFNWRNRSRLIACFGEESALMITADERSLVRIRFDGGPPETLFPR